MRDKLVIVESPAKCKKIESFLGTGFKCVASFGHLRELSSLKDIDIKNNFHPTFSVSDKKRKYINNLKKDMYICCILELKGLKFLKKELVANWNIVQIKQKTM